MKLFRKIDNAHKKILSKLILLKIKLINNRNIKIGISSSFEKNSRLKVFGNNGKIHIGKKFSIGYNSEIYSWNNEILIGNNTSINDNCKIYGNIVIGSNCLFASNIYLSSGSHNFKIDPFLPIKDQDRLSDNNEQIIIEDDCWIGFGVVVMQGIYIGKGAVIGSNTVITKDILPYTVNGGIPNKIISNRLDFFKDIYKINFDNKEHWPYIYKGLDYSQFEFKKNLNDFLKINNNFSVFFLSKSSSNKVRIVGASSSIIHLNIMFNDDLYASSESLVGSFESLLHFKTDKSHNFDYFKCLPLKLKENFNIITVKKVQENLTKSQSNNYWLFKSIEYFE